ncbi:MAG TPA: M15 family metallopeptidase [Thermoleophilaceae bacterium]|nr:M15 family metallopeptidase [Thermoleophilaceae bacterium]
MTTYLQTAIEDAMALARAASGGSGRTPAPPAPTPPAPAAPPPAPSADARAAADAIKVRDHIKKEARDRAKVTRSVPTSSNFYRRLTDFYLKEYLAAPTRAKGKKAAEKKIGKTFAGPATPGDDWEDGALRFWNKQPIPEFARKLRPKLPAELAAATDILSRKNRKALPYIDVPHLVGKANMGTGFDADVAGGGKNISQLMHWATGVKYSDVDKLTMRELFIAYELWHLEAWDVFGEDPINDLIAEEAGRSLGTQLRAGSITKAKLQAKLDEGFGEARAWVGTLLRPRQAKLDDWIVAKTQKMAKIWYGAQPEMDVWGSETIFTMLRAGASVEDVKRSQLAERIVDIYTLIYEADEWEKAHGKIDNGSLIPTMLSGALDGVFEKMAKGQPVVSFEIMAGPTAAAGALQQAPASPPIEGYRSDPTGTACASGPQPGARALVAELGRRFGGRGEIFACRPVRGGSRLSLHGEGRAVDWFRNASDPAQAAEAQRIIDWLLGRDAQGNEHALARRMGIQEVIWNRRIWTARRHAEGWRPYGGVNPHTDHLHIGMNWPGARMQTSYWGAQAGGAAGAPAPAAPATVPLGAAVTFSSAADIDAFFRARTGGRTFLAWFRDTQAGKGAWADRPGQKTSADAERRFTQIWNRIPDMFETPSISLEQFVALQSIFLNEVGWKMAPVAERGGGMKSASPGIAYFFNKVKLKSGKTKKSYNTGKLSKSAYDCFNTDAFIAAHATKPYGKELARTTDKAWAGDLYPRGFPTDIPTAGFIAEADFCKFRGRGMIQTTWRAGYRPITEFVKKYSGANPTVLRYRKLWEPYDVETALYRSSNDDWDQLFQSSDYVVPAAGIRLHNRGVKPRYLAISTDEATRLGTGPGSFHYMGKSIAGPASYGELFRNRCVQVLTALGAAGGSAAPVGSAPAPAPPVPAAGPGASTPAPAEASPSAVPPAPAVPKGPPPSFSLRWDGASPEQLAFMRRVYDTHVRRSARGRAFVASVPDAELAEIERGQRARRAAAEACKQLLGAARAALSAQQAAGNAKALAAEGISVVSAYRSVSHQFSNWQSNFPRYYRETKAPRTAAPGGEHGEQAAELLSRHIGSLLAAPGYSLHNNGLAIDFGTHDSGMALGASSGQRRPWRASWLWEWMVANANRYGFFQNTSIDEPWHWEYRGTGGAPTAQGIEAIAREAPAVALQAVPGGEADVTRVPLLDEHRDAGPDMVLRWNTLSNLSAGVDVVVHLHGFSEDRHLDLRRRKLPLSGLDFSPPAPPRGTGAPAHPAWSGRVRPTLGILPRGRARPDHQMAYDFPALVRPGAFAQLIDVAMRELEARIGAGQRLTARRIILTAHSGGGAPLNRILARTAGTTVDPHEVHVFDALYGDPSGLRGWIDRRLARDVERLRSGGGDPDAYMASEGGALRVLYLHGGDRATTRPNSLRVQAHARERIPAGMSFTDLLQRHYRVDNAAVGHSLIPYWYGGRLLADVTANVPPPRR